jgi:hypothetical protein
MKANELEANKDGWTDWIDMNGRSHRFICCDCGLAHDFEFRSNCKSVKFRVKRNNRSTSQVRRYLKEG